MILSVNSGRLPAGRDEPFPLIHMTSPPKATPRHITRLQQGTHIHRKSRLRRLRAEPLVGRRARGQANQMKKREIEFGRGREFGRESSGGMDYPSGSADRFHAPGHSLVSVSDEGDGSNLEC